MKSHTRDKLARWSLWASLIIAIGVDLDFTLLFNLKIPWGIELWHIQINNGEIEWFQTSRPSWFWNVGISTKWMESPSDRGRFPLWPLSVMLLCWPIYVWRHKLLSPEMPIDEDRNFPVSEGRCFTSAALFSHLLGSYGMFLAACAGGFVSTRLGRWSLFDGNILHAPFIIFTTPTRAIEFWKSASLTNIGRAILVGYAVVYVGIFVLTIWYTFFRSRDFRRFIRQGLCTGCGYDLRASEDRCPECGTPILFVARMARTSDTPAPS